MKIAFGAVLLFVIVVDATEEKKSPFKSASDWINIVNNNPESTWKAGENFDPNLPTSYINKLLGTIIDEDRLSPLTVWEPINEIEKRHIPKHFDARKKWKRCKSLQQIRDQGNCGSCWAVAVTSAFTDRLCISKTARRWNGNLSTRELLSCCSYCGDGCDGGYPDSAWIFIKKNGIVTGGDYNSAKGCQPYPIQPCEHHVVGSRPNCSAIGEVHTPECAKKCTNGHYSTPFEKDHKKAKKVYLVPYNIKSTQIEIMSHGPVVAEFKVHDDFFSYKSGVYQHSQGSEEVGGHAVKVIGWGEENEVPYWLVQNSWNNDWGDKGLFKIHRGNNECGFEQRMSAGIPA